MLILFGYSYPFNGSLWSLVDPAKPWSYPDIFPQSLSFERWKIVWETTSLPEAMFNSYTIAPTVSLITILLSLPTAYAFGRMEFRGKKISRIINTDSIGLFQA